MTAMQLLRQGCAPCGRRAAAATAITVASAQRPPAEMQVFHVEHPFLFAIVDDASGAVLFQGRIVDPR